MNFMEANEFIKKYGFDKAKDILDSIKIEISFDGRVCDPCFITEEGEYVSCSELQPFVKSYELVDSIGGLQFAKNFIKQTGSTVDNMLERAIADVESCQ